MRSRHERLSPPDHPRRDRTHPGSSKKEDERDVTCLTSVEIEELQRKLREVVKEFEVT
jgi:hypothetical protein